MKKIYFITGASGVGKTTLLKALEKKFSHTAAQFFHFDSIGVPSLEEMEKEFGSPSAWQEAKTYEWIKKLLYEVDADTIFFEGQVNANFIHKGFSQHHFSHYKIILIDCNDETMAYRLTHKRNQPELLTQDMRNWLQFLRNQAQTLNIPIIDTSTLSEIEVLHEFERLK